MSDVKRYLAAVPTGPRGNHEEQHVVLVSAFDTQADELKQAREKAVEMARMVRALTKGFTSSHEITLADQSAQAVIEEWGE